MKTLSQILNAVPAADLVESTTWRILNTTLRGLGFERATGSDLRSFKGIAKEDIYHLFGIPMRAGKWADVWFVILDDACAVVNDGKVTMFDHEGEAIKAIQKITVQKKNITEEDSQLDEEVDYYKFKQLAILGLLSPGDANKAALGMKAIEGGHPPTQEQKAIIGDTLVMLVSMITGDSAILNKLKKTARDTKNA
jgi:hypothetical protein